MSLARLSRPSTVARGAALAGALALFSAHPICGLELPASVQPIPDQPRADTAFILEVHSACDGGLLRIEEAAVSVTAGVIRVDTVRRCGPVAVIGAYSYSVVVPPVPAGEYRVEVWARYPADPDPRDEPELTGAITVTEVGPLAGVRCIPGVEPAATLLFPYFEVDPGASEGVTTLLAITNTWTRPVLANVVLWSNWALPVASFEVYLGGSDVQTLNLRDVLAGTVPVSGPGSSLFPGCQPSDVAEGGPDSGRVQQTRFLENPGFDGGTELLVWRDVRESPAGPIACDAPISPFVTWLYLTASLEAFDEERQRAYVTGSLESSLIFPLATQRVPTSSFAPWESGWLRMDLLDQSAVTAIMRGNGRFSAGISSAQLDDPCAGVD